MLFPLKNFVQTLVENEVVYDGSLFKQNNSLEKFPTSVEPYGVKGAQKSPLCALPLAPLSPDYTKNRELKIYCRVHTT